MTTGVLVARVVLASVFAVAGVGKLADPVGTRRAARELGASQWLVSLAVRPLPLLELVVAVALLPNATARAAALAAVALLGLFTAQVIRARLGGKSPDCHCFGRLHHGRAGWRVVGQDAVLAAIAGFIAIGPGSVTYSVVPSWLSGLRGGAIIAVAAAVIEGVALTLAAALALYLVRRCGDLLLRIDELEERRPQSGLAIGAVAPDFSLPTFGGEKRALADLLQRGPTLLVFSDPLCRPCVELLPDVARWQAEPVSSVTPVLITSGALADNRAALTQHHVDWALWDEQHAVAHGYGIQGTPSAVLISEDGRIESQTVLGAPAINRLMNQLTGPAQAVLALAVSGSTMPTNRPGQAPIRLPVSPQTEVSR